MKPKTWHDLTVRQWQALTDLFMEEGNSHIDNIVRAGCIVYDVTEHELDSLSLSDLNDLGHRLAFIHTEVPAKPVDVIHVNGVRYRCVYDVTRMPAARYIESKVYGQDPNADRRFSPPVVLEEAVIPISGSPDRDKISTSL